MKANITSKRKAEEERKRLLREEAVKVWYDLCKRPDVAWLYNNYVNEGYGPKRGERSYLNMIETQVKLIEEFRTCKDDDESHYLYMVDVLKRAGFDLEALWAKADAIRHPEPKYIERQKIIEEYMKNNG